jgi:hypothetical protein
VHPKQSQPARDTGYLRLLSKRDGGQFQAAAIAIEDGFGGGTRCCSAISVYNALAGEKVIAAQNTVAAYAKIFANNMQPLVY